MSSSGCVLDTNLFVSAILFPGSIPDRILMKIIEHSTLLQSEATAAEVREVLSRKKFDKYLPLAKRIRIIDIILDKASFIEISETITICRDPKDNKFLELAVSGSADAIISGDEDLLILHPFREIPILTAREFLDRADL